MNETEKMAQWVEYKIGTLLSEDIEKKVVSEECFFDVGKYSEEMFEKYFANAPEINHLKFEMSYNKQKLDSDDTCLTDDFSQDSSDDDFRPTSLDNIISDLIMTSEKSQLKALESLDAFSAEEMLAHNSWTITKKSLQDMIKVPESRKVSNQVLQLFRRFLLSKDTPQVVHEGFICLGESIAFSIEAFNVKKMKELTQEKYDFKSNKWVRTNCINMGEKSKNYIEVIFKSMWLLVKSQRGIPYKWTRFNEKRLREIVFSFIDMISSTKNFKNSEYLSELEVLAVLDPRAMWCVNWCHGATGRLLLCSALKTHKNLFNEIVDFVLTRIKLKDSIKMENKIKSNSIIKLPSLKGHDNIKIRRNSNSINLLGKDGNKNVFKNEDKYSGRLSVKTSVEAKANHSAPPYPANKYLHSKSINNSSEDWIIKGISKEVVNEAMFCHCLSMVVYLIQYRSGRSLFPVEVTSRRRRITIPDFTLTVLNYLNGIVFFSKRNAITDVYKEHMLKLIEILKSLKNKMF